MNKILLELIAILYKNLGEIVVSVGISLFVYTMFTVNRLCGFFTLSGVILIIGLLISKNHDPK